jgi:hypothetical protein
MALVTRMHVRFKRSKGVKLNGILEGKIPSKNAHRAQPFLDVSNQPPHEQRIILATAPVTVGAFHKGWTGHAHASTPTAKGCLHCVAELGVGHLVSAHPPLATIPCVVTV